MNAKKSYLVGSILASSCILSAYASWDIEMSYNTGGVISNETVLPVQHGSNATFSVMSTNIDFYHIAEIYTNGMPIGVDAMTNFYFVEMSSITDHGTIQAEFARNAVVDLAIPAPSNSVAVGHTASLIVDINGGGSELNTRKLAMTGSMPVDNSALWQVATNWSYPPLGGGMPVAAATNHVVLVYPPQLAPDAPLDLNVAVNGKGDVDLYWRDSDDTNISYVLQWRDVSGGAWSSLTIDANNPNMSSIPDLNKYSQYQFRVAAIENGYVSPWSPSVYLRTRVISSTNSAPVLSPSNYAKSVEATFNNSLSIYSITNVIVQGSQSGNYTSAVEYADGSVVLNGVTADLFPGEQAWIIAPETILDSSTNPILSHAWNVRGDVRFGGGTFGNDGDFNPDNLNKDLLLEKPVLGACAADFDGNGTNDLAINIKWNSSTYYTIVYWDDQLYKNSPNSLPIGPSSQPLDVIDTADFNGDGCADLIFGNRATDVQIVLFESKASFKSSWTNTGNHQSLASADMDNDGDVDIVAVVNDYLHVYANNGLGLFADTPVLINVTGVVDIAAADFNGDGNIDVVLGTVSGQDEYAFINTGRDLQQDLAFPSADLKVRSVFAVDPDNDQDADLFFLKDVDSELWINDGYGVFSRTYTNIGNSQLLSTTAAVGDFNGDKVEDMIIGLGGLNDDPYIISSLVNAPIQLGVDAIDVKVVLAADWDADGSIDLFFGSSDRAEVFYNQPPPLHIEPEITWLTASDLKVEWSPSPSGDADGYAWELWNRDSIPIPGDNFLQGTTTNLYVEEMLSGYTGVDAGTALEFIVKPFKGIDNMGDERSIHFSKPFSINISVEGEGSYLELGGDAAYAKYDAIASNGYLLAAVQTDPSNIVVQLEEFLPISECEIFVDQTVASVDVTLFFRTYTNAIPSIWLNAITNLDPGGLAITHQDVDGDGALNWEEFYAKTSPTNEMDVLHITDWNPASSVLTWVSVSNLAYVVESSPTLTSNMFSAAGSEIIATDSVTSAIVTNNVGDSAFIRVRLKIK